MFHLFPHLGALSLSRHAGDAASPITSSSGATPPHWPTGRQSRLALDHAAVAALVGYKSVSQALAFLQL